VPKKSNTTARYAGMQIVLLDIEGWKPSVSRR
jgi:hypothetical protein